MVTERSELTRRQALQRLTELAEGGARWTLYAPAGRARALAAGAQPGWPPEGVGWQAVRAGEGWPCGMVAFLRPGAAEVCLPPFPLDHEGLHPEAVVGPLRRHLEAERVLGIVLLRLGGFAVGISRGEALLATKTGSRLVHGRHRAGGSSAGRFQRRREKEIEALFKKACQTVEGRLAPHREALDHILLGGEKVTLARFRQACRFLEEEAGKVLERRLDPVATRRADLEEAARQAWTSRWIRLEEAADERG